MAVWKYFLFFIFVVAVIVYVLRATLQKLQDLQEPNPTSRNFNYIILEIVGVACYYLIPANLRCICFVMKNGLPERHKALQLAITALDYVDAEIKIDQRDRRRLDISLKENEGPDTLHKVGINIRAFTPLCLVWFLHLLGYSTVTVTVGNSIAKEPVQFRGKDVRLRSIWKLREFILLFVKLAIVTFVRFSKVSFGLRNNGTWFVLDFLDKSPGTAGDNPGRLTLPTGVFRNLDFVTKLVKLSKVSIDFNEQRVRLRLESPQENLDTNSEHEQLVREQNLLKQGADTSIRDEDGFTAYETALKFGFVDSLSPFLPAQLKRTLRKETLVYLAASVRDVRVLDGLLSSLTAQEVQAALQYEDESGNSALACAVKNGHLEVLKRVLMEVQDPGKVNKRGETALDIATKMGRENKRIIQLLAEKSGLLVINREKGTLELRIPWRGNGRLT